MAEAHRRTTLAMTDLRSTLRDEHHCLLQVGRLPMLASPDLTFCHDSVVSLTLKAFAADLPGR